MAFMLPSLRGGLKRNFEQTRSTILSCISRGYPAASVNEGEYAPTDSELVGIVRERDGLAILHNPIENKVAHEPALDRCLFACIYALHGISVLHNQINAIAAGRHAAQLTSKSGELPSPSCIAGYCIPILGERKARLKRASANKMCRHEPAGEIERTFIQVHSYFPVLHLGVSFSCRLCSQQNLISCLLTH